MKSPHLDKIISSQGKNVQLQIVFCDIEKYSERRSQAQMDVIDQFTKCLVKARQRIADQHEKYTEKNALNFLHDIIIIPTGDGAAIAFSFNGLNDIHLEFSKIILEETNKVNIRSHCPKFSENGWCNCHSNFNLKVGVSEGKGIVYRDANSNYNVAGGVVNMAARVMNFAERNNIIFTEEAYNQIIDMVDNPNLADNFTCHDKVKIKHGRQIKVYQYINPALVYLNSTPPSSLQLMTRMYAAMENFPMKPLDVMDAKSEKIAQEKIISVMENCWPYERE
jgi:class 3 adenylate cyclase